MAETEKKGNRFSNFLKNLFFLILILQFAPMLITGIKKQIKKVVNPDTYVGCIKIGTISDASNCVKQIHKFQKRSDIKAILLKINSPGGAPGASQAIFNELKKFKAEKPVVAMVEDLCASGGYYVACVAEKIISNPAAIIGNIGSKWVIPNIKEFLNHYNVKVDEIQSGKFKTLLSMTKDRTPEETTLLQNFSDDVYRQFYSDVAKERNLSIANKNVWADGKIFTGEQAIKLKLIDQLGSISETKETISKLLVDRKVEIKGKIKLIYPKVKSRFEKLFSGDAGGEENEGITKIVASSLCDIWNTFLTNITNKNVLN